MDETEKKILIDLTENMAVVIGKITVLMAAVHAIARTHPTPDACAADFRNRLEFVLALQDDAPLPESIRSTMLVDVNAILEALGQLRS